MDPTLQLYERIPDENTTHSVNFDPSNYKSIQDKVNNDPQFEKEYFDKLVDEGWVKLKNVEDLLYYTPGKTFKYRLNGTSLSGAEKGIFRSGGFFVGKSLESDDYILYKAYNGCIFPLQIKDLQTVYVQDPSKKIIKFNYPIKETNHPVYLPDPISGNPVIVYYARRPNEATKFQQTPKFKQALRTNNWTFA
jgi:hypothetical protein